MLANSAETRRIPASDAGERLIADAVCLLLWRRAGGKEQQSVRVNLAEFAEQVDRIGIAGISVSQTRSAFDRIRMGGWASLVRTASGEGDLGNWKTNSLTRTHAKKAADELQTVLMPVTLSASLAARRSGDEVKVLPAPLEVMRLLEESEALFEGLTLYVTTGDRGIVLRGEGVKTGSRRLTDHQRAWLTRHGKAIMPYLPLAAREDGMMLTDLMTSKQIGNDGSVSDPGDKPLTVGSLGKGLSDMPRGNTNGTGLDTAPAISLPEQPTTHRSARPVPVAVSSETRIRELLDGAMEILSLADSAARDRARCEVAERAAAALQGKAALGEDGRQCITDAAEFLERLSIAMAGDGRDAKFVRSLIEEIMGGSPASPAWVDHFFPQTVAGLRTVLAEHP